MGKAITLIESKKPEHRLIADLLLKEETEMSLEKNNDDKNFSKKEISINELLELTRKKDLIRVIIYTKD